MASAVVQARLRAIQPSTKNMADRYKEVLVGSLKEFGSNPVELKNALETYLSAGNLSCTHAFITNSEPLNVCKSISVPNSRLALDESLGIVEVKSILSHFAEKIPEIDRSVLKYVCSYALGRIQSRIVSFEEQV